MLRPLQINFLLPVLGMVPTLGMVLYACRQVVHYYYYFHSQTVFKIVEIKHLGIKLCIQLTQLIYSTLCDMQYTLQWKAFIVRVM